MSWRKVVCILTVALAASLPLPENARAVSDADEDRRPSTRPAVFILGLMGSALCSAAKGDVVWGVDLDRSVENLDRLSLAPGVGKAPEKLVPCGLIPAHDLNPLVTVSRKWVDRDAGILAMETYSRLLPFLEGLGYDVIEPRRNRSGAYESCTEKGANTGNRLYIFDYDWRQSNFETAESLGAFIACRLPEGRFDIIAHSMGGLPARILLERSSTLARRAHSLVTMGTPHLGAARSLSAIYDGWGEGWVQRALNGFNGGRRKVSGIFLSFPSSYEMLPTYEDCCWLRDTVDTDVRGGLAPNLGIRPRRPLDPAALDFWARIPTLPEAWQTGRGGLRAALAPRLRNHRRLRALMARRPGRVKFYRLATRLIATERSVTLRADGRGILERTRTAGDKAVIFESAVNDGRHGTFIESEQKHERIFDSDLARHNLAVALERMPGPFKTLKKERRYSKADFDWLRRARLVPDFSADVAFNWFDAELPAGPVRPAAALSLAAEVDFSFALEAEGSGEKYLAALERLKPLRERLLRAVAAHGLDSLCLERGRALTCLEAGEITLKQTEGTGWHAVMRFTGRAGGEGVYDLKLATPVSDPIFMGAVLVREE